MQVRSPAEVRQAVATLVMAAAALARNTCITNGGGGSGGSVSPINTVTHPGFPI